MVQRHAIVRTVALVLTTALLVTEATHAQRTADTGFVITNVRVFDGARTLGPTRVAVSEGIIQTVGTSLPEWQSVEIVDGSGATLLPGLIDAHVHVRDADDLRQSLVFGVTTVLDMGAVVDPKALFALRDAARVAADMAELRSAGFFAGAPQPDSPPDPRISVNIPAVATVEEARQFVAMRHAEGSDYLKFGLRGVRSASTGAPNLDEPRVTALVETAHAAGLLTVAHIETLDDVGIALSAGVDGLAHVWRRGGTNPQMARRIAERGVFVMPTLAGGPDGFLPEGRLSLLADPRFAAVLSTRINEHLSRSFASRTPGLEPRVNLDGQLAATRDVYEAGAKILVGTDANRDNPAAFGISVHRELELLRQAGMSASDALAAATANPATAFRLEDRGKIAPGYRADMLLVRGDPTTDILATRDIIRVWKSGIEVDRKPTTGGQASN